MGLCTSSQLISHGQPRASPTTARLKRRWGSACGISRRRRASGRRRGWRPSAGRGCPAFCGKVPTGRCWACSAANLLEWGQFLYRNDNFLALLAAEPDRAHDLLERLTEVHMRSLEKYLGLVGPYIDVIVFQRRPGMQTGPQISPRMLPRVLQASAGRLASAKELADVKVMLHSCGGIRLLLQIYIEAGLDGGQPGADQLQRYGGGGFEAGLRQRHHLLGRRLRYAVAFVSWHAGGDQQDGHRAGEVLRKGGGLCSSRCTHFGRPSRRRT